MSIQTSINYGNQDLLLCNSGSTTLKLQARSLGNDKPAIDLHFSGTPEELGAALAEAIALSPAPLAIAHRIVHAGAVTEQAQLVDADLSARISHWSPLAPLHNPLAISLIEKLRERWPQIKQYAVFDSGLYA